MFRCENCALDLQDKDSYQSHLEGKRHKKNTYLLELKNAQIQNSIYVNLYRVNTDGNEILSFFESFGEIKYFKFNENYAIVEYTTSQPATFLLTRPIYYQNHQLRISKRILKPIPAVHNNDPNKGNESWEFSYKNIRDELEEKLTFDKQLEYLLAKINLTDNEIHCIYDNICSILAKDLQQVYPECAVYKFGSTVSGLGFKNCDLDIFVDIRTGPMDKDSDFTKKVFANVKKLMYRKSILFSKIIPIPRAKTPIIKFTYVPQEISCDVNFKNDLGVHNSNLIKHCLSYDQRLKPAMLIIKYWAKEFKLTGSGLITNYSLVMMFLFYIQQPDVALAPTILQLKENCEPKIVEGWQVNFNKDYQFANIDNTMSVTAIVQGFFEFYSKFSFNEMVICPLDGEARAKKVFENVDNLPECMNRYKEYVLTSTTPPAITFNISSPMCLQDPNELCYNITNNVPCQILENLIKQCQLSYQVCLKFVDDDTSKDLLPQLLTVTDPEMNKKRKASAQTIVFKPVEPPRNLVNWYKSVIECIRDIFENIYKFQVKYQPLDSKQQKLEVSSDVHSNNQNKDVFSCTGDFCTWFNRKAFKVASRKKNSYREAEVAVTNAIIKSLQGKKKAEKVVDFKCFLELHSDTVNISVKFKDEKSLKPYFNEMCSYFKSKLSFQIYKCLLEATLNS